MWGVDQARWDQVMVLHRCVSVYGRAHPLRVTHPHEAQGQGDGWEAVKTFAWYVFQPLSQPLRPAQQVSVAEAFATVCARWCCRARGRAQLLGKALRSLGMRDSCLPLPPGLSITLRSVRWGWTLPLSLWPLVRSCPCSALAPMTRCCPWGPLAPGGLGMGCMGSSWDELLDLN